MKLIKIFILFNFLWIFSLNTFAQNETHLDLKKEYKSKKNELRRKERKERRVLANIYKINQKIRKLRFQNNRLFNESLFLKAKIKDVSKKIVKQKKITQTLAIKIKKILTSNYKSSKSVSSRAVFLAPKEMLKIQKNNNNFKYLAKMQAKVFNEYEVVLARLSHQKEELKKEVKDLIDLENDLKSQEKELASEQKRKSRLLRVVRNQQNKFKNKIRKISNKVISENETFLDQSFFEIKGKMPRPVSGIVYKRYGLDYSEKYKTKQIHKGLFISARSGSDVKSVFDGKVVFSGDIPGYGLSLIVDHGDNYHTAYFYNRSLSKKMGDQVIQNEVVAVSGYSPVHKRPGLYFELRHYSEALDPSSWFEHKSIKVGNK